MAFANANTVWYASAGDMSTTGYFAVTKRPQNTAVVAGVLRRQFTAPAYGAERVFVCTVAGTTANTADATWSTGQGASTTDGTAHWLECTGQPGVNGDLTGCPNWTFVKNKALSQGTIIQRNSGASLQIVTSAGTTGNGSEPAFSNTAGVTTSDNSVTWTSLGAAPAAWSAPACRFQNLLSGYLNAVNQGDTIYVADNSAETASTNPQYAFPGSNYGNPLKIISIDHTAALPPTGSSMKAGGSVQTLTSTQHNFTSGFVYFWGMTFICGSGANASIMYLPVNGNQEMYFDNCSLQTGGTGGTSKILVSGNAAQSYTHWNNCTVKFGATSDYLQPGGGRWVWINSPSAILGSTFPTLFINAPSPGSQTLLHGVDLSALGSGKTIYTPGASQNNDTAVFIDCKLGASVTLATQPANGNIIGGQSRFMRCSAAAGGYMDTKYDALGTQSVETTITRTGGATDGSQAQSWKLVTTAYPIWTIPFESDLIRIWNATTGSSKTLTIYGITGSVGLPNNDDIWIEATYLGDSGDSAGLFVNSTKTNLLTTNAACTSDGSSWGGGSTAFSMAVTFTPQQAGYVYVRIKVAKVSATFYIDPKPVIV